MSDSGNQHGGPLRLTVADPTRPLRLRGGGVLPQVELEYHTWGTPTPERDNAILVCHSFSSDSFATGTDASATATSRAWRIGRTGWWDALIGPGKAIDTDRWWVVCSNVLGGSGGSTGPASIDPATRRPWGSSFPALHVADMVEAQRRLMDGLGIPRWRLVVGGSMGGVQALAWAVMGGERVERAIAIAAAAALAPAGRQHFRAGQDLVRLDLERGGAGQSGLLAALATAQVFSGGPATTGDPARLAAEWPRERFDPHSFLVLSQALLEYDLARDWGGGDLTRALAAIRAEVTLLGYRGDRVFAPTAQDRLAAGIRRAGGRARSELVAGGHGHDSFLAEPDNLAPWLRDALTVHHQPAFVAN